MRKNVSTSYKCCATCIYWNGKVKYSPGFFGSNVEFDDSEKAKCNNRSGWSSAAYKGTDGSGLIFSCSSWKRRFE